MVSTMMSGQLRMSSYNTNSFDAMSSSEDESENRYKDGNNEVGDLLDQVKIMGDNKVGCHRNGGNI